MLRRDAVALVYYPIYAVQIMYGRNICRKQNMNVANAIRCLHLHSLRPE